MLCIVSFSALWLLRSRIYKKKRMNWTRRRWMWRVHWRRRSGSLGLRTRSSWARRLGYWRWSVRSRLWSKNWRRGRRREKIRNNSCWTWRGRRADSQVSTHDLLNCNSAIVTNHRVLTDTGKPGKMRQLFPVREKSGNFEKILKSQGKVREFWVSQGKLGFIN